MSTEPAPLADPAPSTPPPPAADDARRLIAEQLQMLKRVAQVGLELSLEIERQAKGEGADGQPPAPLGDLALAYSRTTRALRLTVMLQSRLTKDLEGIDSLAEIRARSAAALEETRRRDPVYVHKDRVERIVERVARDACGEDEDALERLMVEACDRLDDEDLYGEVLDRPVGELVALVCRDLGLDPDWTRLAEEAWARAEIDSAAAGSPFLALLRQGPPPDAAAVAPNLAPAGAFACDTS
jgi:hypothetical protein